MGCSNPTPFFRYLRQNTLARFYRLRLVKIKMNGNFRIGHLHCLGMNQITPENQ